MFPYVRDVFLTHKKGDNIEERLIDLAKQKSIDDSIKKVKREAGPGSVVVEFIDWTTGLQTNELKGNTSPWVNLPVMMLIDVSR